MLVLQSKLEVALTWVAWQLRFSNLNSTMCRDMNEAMKALLERQMDRKKVAENGPLTEPRSYGVYAIPPSSGATRRFRFGNHPVRLRELVKEFGSCEFRYLFLNRDDAVHLSKLLNEQASSPS